MNDSSYLSKEFISKSIEKNRKFHIFIWPVAKNLIFINLSSGLFSPNSPKSTL